MARSHAGVRLNYRKISVITTTIRMITCVIVTVFISTVFLPRLSYAATRTAATSCILTTVDSGCGWNWADGDTLVINSGVTVIVSSNQVAGTGTGTAIAVNGTGMLIVAAANLTMNGDLVQQRGSTVDIQPDGVIEFNPGANSIFSWKGSNVGAGFYISKVSGTPGHHGVLKKSSGSLGTVTFDFGSASSRGEVIWNFARVENLGDQLNASFSHYTNQNNQRCVVKNSIFSGCYFYSISCFSGSAVYTWENVDFRESKGRAVDNLIFYSYGTADIDVANGGIRSFDGLTFYSTFDEFAAGRTAQFGMNDMTVSNSVFYNIASLPGNAAVSKRQSYHHNIYIVESPGFYNPALTITPNNGTNVTDCVFLLETNNQHFVSELLGVGGATRNNIGLLNHGNIMDGAGYVGNNPGDCVVQQGDTNIIGNIAINSSGSFTFMGQKVSVGGGARFENNTHAGGAYIAVSETGVNAYTILSFRNNFLYNTLNVYRNNAGYIPQESSDWDYNGFLNDGFPKDNLLYPPDHPTLPNTLSYMSGVANRAAWFANGKVFGVDNARHDIKIDPLFHDVTVTVAKYFGAGSTRETARIAVTRNGFDYGGNQVIPSEKNISGCLSFIRNGFTPTSPALAVPGGPGFYIGAVPPAELPLEISIQGGGPGSVVSLPDGIDCNAGGGTCRTLFGYGASVSLTANYNAQQSRFSGWGGDCSGCSGSPCVIKLDSSKQCTASFTKNVLYQLTATSAGSGGGSINSKPPGFICTQGKCVKEFLEGTSFVLYATPDSNSSFVEWGNDCTGVSCTIQMYGPRDVKATFTHVEPVRIAGTLPRYFPKLQAAYNALQNDGIIQVRGVTTKEPLIFNAGTAVVIKGGYDTSYEKNIGMTSVEGSITLGNGSLVAEGISIK